MLTCLMVAPCPNCFDSSLLSSHHVRRSHAMEAPCNFAPCTADGCLCQLGDDSSLAGLVINTVHPSTCPAPHPSLQVLTAPRPRGSRMRINRELAKQHARKIAPFGLTLWRLLLQPFSSSNYNRARLTPAQVRSQLDSFAASSDANRDFVNHADNANMAAQLIVPHEQCSKCCWSQTCP